MSNLLDNSLILKLEKLNDELKKLSFEELISLSKNNQDLISNGYLYSNNIESIEIGISGYLLFLLEFYKHAPDDTHLLKVKSITKDLILYCRNNQTSNYSFYTGRGGFIYYLLQLYKINKDESILDECLELIKPCGGEYLESIYTTDYLYNGRAGTLLVLIELYQVTNSDDILHLINQFSIKIVKNGFLSEEGISWRALEEINLKNSCGFALGTSGILYVLKKLNSCFPNKAIDYVIGDVQKYIENCWDEDKNNWKIHDKDIINKEILNSYKKEYKDNNEHLFNPKYDSCWSRGKAGVQLSYNIQNINLEVPEIQFTKLKNNVYEGVSGIGLCLLNNLDKNSDTISKIVDFLMQQEDTVSLEGGLFFGDLGKYYFLLKFTSGNNGPNIINPGLLFSDKKDDALDMDLVDVKKSFLKKQYHRTITLLEHIAPKSINQFLLHSKSNKADCEISSFQSFIENELKTMKDAPAYDLLKDVYDLEKTRKEISDLDKRTNLQIYLDSIFYKEKTLDLLNNSDEWIFNQKITISDSIEIVNSKWNWNDNRISNIIENFYAPPSHYEYLFFSSYENRINEYSLGIDGLVLHRFDEGNTFNQALTEIKLFCRSQPPEILEEFVVNTGSKDVQDFINRLDFLIIYKVKQLLYDKILEFN